MSMLACKSYTQLILLYVSLLCCINRHLCFSCMRRRLIEGLAGSMVIWGLLSCEIFSDLLFF
jgi:hypothetical protein